MTTKTYNPVRGSTPRSGGVRTIGSEPSYDIVKAMLHLARSGGDIISAKAAADIRGDNERVVEYLKASVEAGSTNPGNWMEPVTAAPQTLGSQFLAFQRPASIIGKFGTGGRPGFTKVPFRVKLPRQTSPATGYWVRQGFGKPVSKWSHDLVELDYNKVATISVFTDELIRFSSIDVLNYARKELANALTATLDTTFIDPSVAAIEGERPGSVLNGVTPLAASGIDADAVREDVRRIFEKFISADNPPTSGVWVMHTSIALALSLMLNPLGGREFPEISMLSGGRFFELPVITSNHVPAGIVALINSEDILMADDSQYSIDVSNEASLELSDDPENNVIEPQGRQLTSLWQTNATAVRAERIITWEKRRDSAAAYLAGVRWGNAVALT